MTEPIEISETVRVYITDLDEAPNSADLEVADRDDPGEYYYEVHLDELGKRIGKRYIRYDGPEGQGFYDAVKGELHTRSRSDTPENEETLVKNKIFEKVERILDKYKIYISDASTRAEAEEMAPEWADVQETQQGAFYYEKLPGQGGGDGDLDEDALEVGDYEVDTRFGKIVADRVLNDDVGDIPVDDFHEYMDEVDDPGLVKDALQAEIDGPNRKTGKQFIETRARALDIDLDVFYKDSGPDKTGSGSITSLSDEEVDVDSLSDEVVVSAEENDHTTQDWSVQKLYQHYVLDDNQMPSGMGNPDDIPGGTLSRVLEEEVDDPSVLMDFYTEGGYQQRRDVSSILEEQYGINAKVETVDSELRFDLDEMEQWMPEEEVQELEPGDHILMDDFAGGFQEAKVEQVTATGLEVSSPDGMGATHEISFLDVYNDEYAVASMLENDAGNHAAAGMLDYKFPEGVIERIEDDSVLSRAKQWEEQENSMDIRPETFDRINARLAEVSPPDPEEYGLTEESMNLLHGATWPEWDDKISKGAGNGLEKNLKTVYEQASTEDLEKYARVCEEHGLEDRGKVVDGMLFYREDSDVGLRDIFEYEQVAHGNYLGVTDDVEDRIMSAAEDAMNLMQPYAGAQIAGHIERFELKKPPGNSNWTGQCQTGGRVMAIDNPHNVERTTAHEMGHALHNFMGIKNDGYGTIDNRNYKGDPDKWRFGSHRPEDANEVAKEFYDDMEQEWDRYVETMKGESDEAREIRGYQKRHGVELMAVGFGTYVTDPYKLRNRHPSLASVFDKHVGPGVTADIKPEDAQEGSFYNVVIEGKGRETIEVERKEEYERGDVEYLIRGVDADGRVNGREWVGSDKLVFEQVEDGYEPVQTEHGMKHKVEIDGEEKEVFIDRDTTAMGGDFFVRDSLGRPVGQWSKGQLQESMVEQNIEEGEIPWSPDQAERGDLVKMHGVEVNVQEVDTWDDELILNDSTGERRTVSFEEVNEMRQNDNFEPVANVVDWGEIESNKSYQFVSEEGDRYNGKVVGFDKYEVVIEQSGIGESTIERDGIEEIRRRA